MRLVVPEQHRFLRREVPEERALGDAGLRGQLRHRHIGEPVPREPLQRYSPQRLVRRLVTLLVQVDRHGHGPAMVSQKFVSTDTIASVLT